jgi:hypothetical protein
MFMDRRLMAGGLAIVCLSVGSLGFAPGKASAATRPITCDARLANCADNATNNYDNCICDVTNGGDDCLQMYAAPDLLRQSGPTTVQGCVVQLQGDLVKCQVADLACTLLNGPGKQQ